MRYAPLAGLTATLAASVPLPVPVLAAVGGVVFLAETVSVRLIVCSLLIVGRGPGPEGKPIEFRNYWIPKLRQ